MDEATQQNVIVVEFQKAQIERYSRCLSYKDFKAIAKRVGIPANVGVDTLRLQIVNNHPREMMEHLKEKIDISLDFLDTQRPLSYLS